MSKTHHIMTQPLVSLINTHCKIVEANYTYGVVEGEHEQFI